MTAVLLHLLVAIVISSNMRVVRCTFVRTLSNLRNNCNIIAGEVGTLLNYSSSFDRLQQKSGSYNQNVSNSISNYC